MHDYIFLSYLLYEPLARGRRLLSATGQQAADSDLRDQYRCFVVRDHACCNLSIMAYLHYCVHMLFILFAVYDYLEHTKGLEVSVHLTCVYCPADRIIGLSHGTSLARPGAQVLFYIRLLIQL